jgi:hypothetical protein
MPLTRAVQRCACAHQPDESKGADNDTGHDQRIGFHHPVFVYALGLR